MEAEIKKQHYGYSVTIGDYFIRISETTANLQNTHGNYENFPEVLQYCKDNFPSLKTLEFTDDSKIILDNVPSGQPFFISYLSIAKYGKTLFEDKFSAKMKNTESYLLYRKSIEILKKPIAMNFQHFIYTAQITDEQAKILKKYFDPAISWNDFFSKIPDNLQYFSCFGWIQSFINSLLKNTYIMNNWYIEFI
jgi:hypothetical protein